jgi:hypothetical protein
MGARCRIVLPAVMGAITVPLTIWDIHNERVTESMGMAWDIGAPVWPYQTPDILLRLLNGPAYFVALPIANAFRLFGPRYYITVIPAVLIWWWLVGLGLDRGRLPVGARWRWVVVALLAISAVLLMWAAVAVSANAFHWWFKYASSFKPIERSLLMVSFLSPAVWCTVLAFLLVVGAKRAVTRDRNTPGIRP